MDKKESRERIAREMGDVITRWKASGQSGREFASEAKISVAKLWYWSRRSRAKELSGSGFVPLRVIDEARDDLGFGHFELIDRRGWRLRIPQEFSDESLRKLLGILGTC
jgi:hypothetical protein